MYEMFLILGFSEIETLLFEGLFKTLIKTLDFMMQQFLLKIKKHEIK
jgi:hypothetical protein